MRSLLLSAAALVLVAAASGCDSKPVTSGPAPSSHEAPAPGRPTAAAPAPATIVYAGRGAIRTVHAVVEDGSAASVILSAAGTDTTFAGTLPGRRALLAEHAADGSIAALVAVDLAAGDRVALGAFPAGKYRDVGQMKADGGDVAVELVPLGAGASDVYSLRDGEAPRLLASGATVVAVAGGRAAFLAGGALASVAMGGGGPLALGGSDGHDRVVEVRGDRVLLTLHDGLEGVVRVTGLDGQGRVDLAAPGLDQRAVGFAPGQRLVFTRRTAAGAMLVSASVEGAGEKVLTAADLDAKAYRVSPEGLVFFGSSAGALLAVPADGGAARVLDPTAGLEVTIGAVAEGHVIYKSEGPHWPALRAARLDGGGHASLCETVPQVPFFGGVLPDGRVVFYRSLAGQLEGGRVFGVRLDGSDARPLGSVVAAADGTAIAGGPSDQDFEAITASGRVILEAEFEATGGGSKLVAGEGDAARVLTGPEHARFAALVP